ncbi:hypothetical protein JYU34_001969 [Plutella xylostella]|uniref:Uncharacterized protein n=1 Tax=Plutella xylostella TaxID=51655 RepID=A0ABQ7R577_PLUXY|nr:hypothetical protein JYU34_001969 [Plutella xylostella]
MWSGKKCPEPAAGAAEAEIKVVLVGDTQCGKTSLVQRFVSDTFIERPPSIISSSMWSGKKCPEPAAGAAEAEIKVVLVGDTQCGKTSLVQRFVSDTFIEGIEFDATVLLLFPFVSDTFIELRSSHL